MAWQEIAQGAELEPGSRYRVELGLPDFALDLFARERDRMMGLARAAVRAYDRRLLIETGGVQHGHLPNSNVQTRYLVLQLRVLTDEELPHPVTEAGVPVGSILRVLTVIAVAIGVNAALFTVYRISKEMPAAAVEDAAAAARNLSALVPVAVVVGGLVWGLPWLQRKGIL